MSRRQNIPDTYIDPWTGEEKKVQSWDDDNDVPLNSPHWAGHEYDGLDLPESASDLETEEKQICDWRKRKCRQKMIWFYVAFGLLFLIINFWIFRGALL